MIRTRLRTTSAVADAAADVVPAGDGTTPQAVTGGAEPSTDGVTRPGPTACRHRTRASG